MNSDNGEQINVGELEAEVMCSPMKRRRRRLNRRMFSCTECQYTTKQRCNFTRHLMRHSCLKPYHCPDCDYKALRSDQLRRHRKKHSGERPFPCPQCQYRAKLKASLEKHLLCHRNVKNLRCEECDFQTHVAWNLEKHGVQSRHKPFKCQQCDYRARRADHVRQHKMIHAENRPFECFLCDYRARQSAHLKRHMGTHANRNAMYQCAVCAYEFERMESLREHMSEHIPQNALGQLMHESITDANIIKLKQESIIEGNALDEVNLLNVSFYNEKQSNSQLFNFKKNDHGFKMVSNKVKSLTEQIVYEDDVKTTVTSPDKCRLCIEGFSELKNLILHMQVHDEYDGLKCPLCEKVCFSTSNLASHMADH